MLSAGIDGVCPELLSQARTVERDAVSVGEPGLVQNLRIAAIIRARRFGRGNTARDGVGVKKPSPGRRAVNAADAARHQHDGKRQRVAGARFVQSHQARRGRCRRDRRGQIGRPDAAIEDLRSVAPPRPKRVAISVPTQIALAISSGSNFCACAASASATGTTPALGVTHDGR